MKKRILIKGVGAFAANAVEKVGIEFAIKTHRMTMEKFIQLTKDKIPYLKNLGKPTMGWSSIFTPEEIIYAAGITPFRITGEEKPASIKSRAVLSTNICPYTLSCLEEGIQDVYNFLDGIVIVNTCDARRRLYDAWRIYVKTPFVHIIDLPKMITPEAKSYFKDQVLLFKKAVESHFKCKINEKSLKEAISLWNETRYLLNQLYELRKRRNPPINGNEALAIIKASMSGNRKDFNTRLDSLLKSINDNPDSSIRKPKRILITGSYFDQSNLIELIEESGAIVVCEDLSNGIKYFEGEVNIDKEPIEALADYYLEKATCARMVDSEGRFKRTLSLIADYNIDAVIYFSLKFCDSNLIDFPYQKDKLAQHGIPALFLEGERTLINMQQLKTRIQAFLEINGML